jgi:hypothetical protein
MKNLNTKNQVSRHLYLEKFPDVDDMNRLNFPNGNELGDSIVDLIKEKSLTYQEAYMGLQYAYNKLHYETNFLKLK